MELIHAGADFTEKGEIPHFIKFDAQVGMKTADADSDFELVMHERVWEQSPIRCGDYIYLPDTPWGGRADRVVHSASDERVRIYGTCWRGLLERRAVVPENGQTHVDIGDMEANAMLTQLLGNAPDYLTVSDEDSGIRCTGSIRYKSLLSAAEILLSEWGARLGVSFDNGQIRLWAEHITDHTEEIEFSQEYDSSLVSTEQDEIYNHIVALGQGSMEERDVVQLWRLPDGRITDDGTSPERPDDYALCTYIYDYSSVESLSALKDAARRKLSQLSALKKLEIAIDGSDVRLELGDRAGARDLLTGMNAVLTVTAIRLVIEENNVQIMHTLS